MISKGASYNTTYFIWQNIDENQTVPWVSSLIPGQFSAINFLSSNSTPRKTVIFFS